MEKRIYNGFAFSEKEKEKYLINRQIYSELINKYKIIKVDSDPTEQQLNENDFVYALIEGCRNWNCKVFKAPESMNFDEQALIIDSGNLFFGYYQNSDGTIGKSI